MSVNDVRQRPTRHGPATNDYTRHRLPNNNRTAIFVRLCLSVSASCCGVKTYDSEVFSGITKGWWTVLLAGRRSLPPAAAGRSACGAGPSGPRGKVLNGCSVAVRRGSVRIQILHCPHVRFCISSGGTPSVGSHAYGG